MKKIRAFINDETDSDDQDLGFYRALNQELGETQQNRDQPENQKKEKKREHPLVKLEVTINFYKNRKDIKIKIMFISTYCHLYFSDFPNYHSVLLIG